VYPLVVELRHFPETPKSPLELPRVRQMNDLRHKPFSSF